MEILEPLMDFNFPELLAGDLGRSEDVFRSKNLTAGAPAASLAGDGCARRYSLQDSSVGLFSPQTRDILSRMQSLQMVNQDTYSQVVAAAQMHEESRKSSDTTATESSGGMEPPSIAGRDVSVMTAATSVTSNSEKSNSPVDKISNHSWVDLELEDTLNMNAERFLSFRTITNQPSTPHSPRDISGESRSMSLGYNIKGSAPTDPFSAFSSPAKSFTAATMQPRVSHTYESVRIKQPIDFPARRSSLGHNSADLLSLPYHQFGPRSPTSRDHFTTSHVPRLSPIATSTRPSLSSDRASSHQNEELEEARSMLSLSDDDDDDSDDDSDMMMAMNLRTPADGDEIEAPSIVSPLADLEQWMNQSTIELPHLLQPSKDYQGSRIPIAPEVLDTLRISVACFPETMLLCSSLSIETLRGHAKKIRYRHPNIHTGSQLSLDLPEDTKQSKWKWLGVRRQPESSPTKLRNDSMESPIGTSPHLGCPDWHSMKNIFPNGTDHLCDALYAHILAYNYISFLCPLSAVVTQAARPASTESSQNSVSDASLCRPDGNKIPPKAASLLGLQNNPPTTKARATTTISKTSKPRGKNSAMTGRRENTKSFGPTASRSADDHDQSLKELRLGLAKCIARLVSTLRLTSNEEQGVSSKPVDIKDVDPLFIRALCEVVRCNEERS